MIREMAMLDVIETAGTKVNSEHVSKENYREEFGCLFSQQQDTAR